MNQKNNWLQALRALAAVAVLFFHMKPHWATSPALVPATDWMHWGFAGVDIFFVLSGYVVYLTGSRPGYSPRRFLTRRGLRIYLGYWPVLALTAVATALGLTYASWPPAGQLLRSALLLSPSIFDNWVPTAWSLTYELYFYLWIALILIAPTRWRAACLGAGLALLLAWNAGWYLLARERVLIGQQGLRFALTGFGLEFLAGALLAHLRQSHPAMSAAARAPWFALGGLALIVWGLWAGSLSPMHDRVELLRAGTYGAAGLGFLLLALACSDRHWPVPRPIVALGDASYALYLLHPSLLELSAHLRARLPEGNALALAAFLLALPIVISLLSCLWFRLIEWPLFNAASRIALTRLFKS